ncbi:hypothetical protein B484DRAFT_470670 [Ochromonadaceae sp. CCMP2298]|nr:hypothetical protein B484DRAFT_470670 [Ochromonadaceae sp. CCMP2298]
MSFSLLLAVLILCSLAAALGFCLIPYRHTYRPTYTSHGPESAEVRATPMHPVLRRSVDARRLQARKKSEEGEEGGESSKHKATKKVAKRAPMERVDKEKGPRAKKKGDTKSIGRAYSVEAGICDFVTIRTEGYAYVDKSRYAALLSKKSSMTLLVHPRRQGKTLLLNTMQCLLEREEKLFRGLAVHDEVDWNDGGVPVITMDLSQASAIEGENPMAGVMIFKEDLRKQARDNAKRLKVEVAEGMPDTMFTDLLQAVGDKTKKKAAVLIDEYDYPLLQMLSKNGGQMDERVVKTRAALHTFLLRLKSSMNLTHCQLVTGATTFTLADMLSQINNLNDITHDKPLGGALDFTWAEIEAAFGPHVEKLAGSRNETVAELRAEMERRYGGYCYDGHHKVFNAWDVSRALQEQEVKDYWLSIGLGGWLGKMLVPSVAPALLEDGITIPELGDGNKLDKGLFEAMRSKSAIDYRQAWRVLLQAGYLTVVKKKQINDEASLVQRPRRRGGARRHLRPSAAQRPG